jgi:hypothetical protein
LALVKNGAAMSPPAIRLVCFTNSLRDEAVGLEASLFILNYYSVKNEGYLPIKII